MELSTGAVTRLTHNKGLDDYPAWSPDGKRLAWTSNRRGNFEIYVMHADGTNPRNATNNPAIDNFPAWTPDGRLTFVSNRSGGFEVYVEGK
jgi:TolB protein